MGIPADRHPSARSHEGHEVEANHDGGDVLDPRPEHLAERKEGHSPGEIDDCDVIEYDTEAAWEGMMMMHDVDGGGDVELQLQGDQPSASG